MKGTVLLLLCVITAQATEPQLTARGTVCHCNAGEAASVCSQNGSDNELIVHENCNQFYICSNGQAIPNFCPGQTLYNPLAEVCDWPQNVQCGDRPIASPDSNGSDNENTQESNATTEVNVGNENGSGGTCNCNPEEAPALCAVENSGGVLVAHQNCNQFYKCDHGVPVTLNCPPGLLYNPYLEQCDWPHNVECGDRPIVEIDSGGDNHDEIDCEGNENDESGGGGDNGGTCNCNPAEAPKICAVDGSDGILVAHTNCNQFYKCDHGVPVTLSCPSGLLYNPYKEQCDWSYNVDCGDKPIIEIDSGGNGNQTGGSDNSGTCHCDPGEAPKTCAASGSEGTLIAHENCNQFYKCINGAPVAISCPAGLVYNPYNECCDWPANVDCGNKPIIEIDGAEIDDNDNGGGSNEIGSGGGSVGENNNENNDGTCNCNPNEAPEICGVDGSDGTFIAHENCNQFYKCNNGIPVTMNCPVGLVYNPYIDRCDWPANVDCGNKPIVEIDCGSNGDNGSGNGNGDSGSGGGSDGGNSNEDNGGGICNCNPGEAPTICALDGSDGTLIAHQNCNQYYSCVHGTPVTITCPTGLVYNPFIERCDWPYNVDCGEKPIIEVEGGGNGDNGSGDNGSEGGNGDSGSGDNTGACNCNPSEAPQICSVDGSDGTLIAHENCNQYYTCVQGAHVTMNCPAGLVYNPYIERCDWPYNVDCGNKPIIEIEGDGNGDSGSGDNGSGSGNGDNGGGDNGDTCNCNPGEAPTICALDGSDGTLIAHQNCNQYYSCVHGTPVTITCPTGLVYNPFIERCDWPYNVDCGEKPIIGVESGGNGDNGSGDNGSEGGNGDSGSGDNTGACNCNPSEAPQICSVDGSDGTLIAHENCNQYYTCVQGAHVTMNCPAGLVYNPYIERCDWPYNVDCGNKPIIEIEGDGNGDSGSGDNGSGDGNGDSGSGGGSDGGNSNEDNGGSTCNCNPGEAPKICALDGSDGTLIAHQNCNQYYSCVHGTPVTITCPAGLVYNPYVERCDWPYNVDCGNKPIIEVEGGGNGDNGSGDGNGDNGGGDNGGTCNCNPAEAPQICVADNSEGTLIAHENCNQFYKCSNGAPVTINCPAGLVYNPHAERCDWSANVNCGDKPIIDIEGDGDGDNSSGGENDSDSSGESTEESSNENDSGSSGESTEENSNENNEGTCNCNPSEAPSICETPDSNNVLVAHENCNQFYVCTNGVPVSFSCHDGLYYNPFIQRCDWPVNVECGDRNVVEDNEENVDSGNENENSDNENENSNGCDCSDEVSSICSAADSHGLHIVHENCNQFYLCAHGIPICRFCPLGTLFNPLTLRCDWPDRVDCGDRPIVEYEGGNNNSTDNGGEDDSGEDNQSTCNCNPDEAPSICSAAQSDSTLVAHKNCNQYYVCAQGLPVAMFCSGNLLYNPYTQRCDWPSLVDCGDRPIAEVDDDGDDNEDNGSNETGESNDIEIPCDPSQAPAICAAEGSDGILICHESCNRFYVCTNGAPLALNCPANLLYNPEIKDCDWPKNIDCGDRVMPGGGNNDGPCACDAREAPSICAGSESNGKFVAHEYCNQYYVCFEGIPVARSCPRMLFYDPHTEQCLWPTSVNCEGRAINTYSSLNKHIEARRGFF